MKKNPFEKSKKDVEIKGKGREGSPREEKFDRKQMKAAPAFARGGAVKKAGRGC